jgi:transposase-like protein
MTKHYSPEFRTEVAELVVDKGYSAREVADSMKAKNRPPTFLN